jgi:hypothetical protein
MPRSVIWTRASSLCFDTPRPDLFFSSTVIRSFASNSVSTGRNFICW